MESWRQVLRATLPLLPREGLLALLEALRNDDPALIQGATSSPPPLACVQDWPCEGACLVGYCGWKSGLDTVGEVEEFFARWCHAADQALGEPAGCRWLLNWFDEAPREQVRASLLPEIEAYLTSTSA